MLEALKLFNGLCSHYPVSVFSSCLLRVLPNGGTNRFIWDGNYSSFKQWAHHQITTEGWANTSPGTVVSTSGTRARRRQKSPIRQCQITLQACLSFVSTMLFLPVSICFLSAWWLMGCLVEYHVSVSPVRVACSGSALSSSEQRRRATWERRFNWKALCCFSRRFQRTGMTLQPDTIFFWCIFAVYTGIRCDETVSSFERYRRLLWMKNCWQHGNYYNQVIDSRQEAYISKYIRKSSPLLLKQGRRIFACLPRGAHA